MPSQRSAIESVLALCLLVLIGTAAAAATPQLAAEYDCRWTDGPIKIDGRGDEPAWKQAAVIDHFSLPWLEGKPKAKTTTRARLLWDREYLYFLADLEDHDLFADVNEHDGPTWNNDVFELFFKPAADKPGYYEFEINAANTVFDVFIPKQTSEMAGPYVKADTFHVESKVALRGTLNKRTDRDEGWSVEGRIPWRDFLRAGGRPAIDERWKFALCRYDYSIDAQHYELSSSAPLRRPSFHLLEDYATLRFAGPRAEHGHKPFGIEKYVPLLTSRVVGSPAPPPPYRAVRTYPKLQAKFPIAVKSEPGTRRLYYISEDHFNGPTTVLRTVGDPETGESESLLRQDGIAYELAFHPDYQRNGYLYVGLNEPLTGDGSNRKTKIKRYTVSRTPPFKLDPASERVIIEWPSNGHNGGAMVFGLDGMLYVTSGDGTSDSDGDIVGQDLTRLTAKVLRIDVNHPDSGREYSVPRDNPFIDTPGARPETWAYGFRNPWRITADQKTGHIWVGNNGQDLWEQAYLVTRGANYGWSLFEGGHPFYPTRKQGRTPISKPTVEHHHSEARSLTGGLVYYGSKLPELRGAYIYGDHSTGKVWGVRHDGVKVVWHKELVDTPYNITGFGTDADGELLILDHAIEGGFYALEPTPAGTAGANRFPQRLSESGLFRTVAGHVMQPGLIPYSVKAQLWSDGAYKERYLALPGKDTWITPTESGGWKFPEGTVVVKSFALEMEAGKQESRRWIETRFLTFQQKEWVGYSYVWNDEQTDATLVAGDGLDRDYSIRVPRSASHPEGVRKQAWHYPSRTECMVCHSRAANFVLGLSTLQMNCDHDYGPVRDNQLRTLEHLGLLRVNAVDHAKQPLQTDARQRGIEAQSDGKGQRAPVESKLLVLPPEDLPRLVDPYDRKTDLNLRARSYLHSNCAHCHMMCGGGNAHIDLDFLTRADNMKVIGVKPQHHTFSLPEARLVSAGDPVRSVLLYRVAHRGIGQMPPLATTLVDEEAVDMLREWIRSRAAPVPAPMSAAGAATTQTHRGGTAPKQD